MTTKTFCVYIWHDPKDNTPRYVGKGLPERPFVHLRTSGDMQVGRMLKKRIRQGYDPKPTITSPLTEEEAFHHERRLIAEIGRQDLGRGPLFNKTDGGDGVSGRVVTDEQRANLSKGIKAAFGTPEAREKQSARRRAYYERDSSGREKTGRASAARWDDPAFAERHLKIVRKPCTVDGITIYPSCTALAAALGYGKNGTRSPSFRYIDKEQT
jgi:hypothetical protein